MKDGKLEVYIASSWKNQHAVEMLTQLLRNINCEVYSFVENSNSEGFDPTIEDDKDWFKSKGAEKCFTYDILSIMDSDIIIYIGPSGLDAWAEIGMAYGLHKRIIGITSYKGEQIGLMRNMIEWYDNYNVMIASILGAKDRLNDKTLNS